MLWYCWLPAGAATGSPKRAVKFSSSPASEASQPSRPSANPLPHPPPLLAAQSPAASFGTSAAAESPAAQNQAAGGAQLKSWWSAYKTTDDGSHGGQATSQALRSSYHNSGELERASVQGAGSPELHGGPQQQQQASAGAELGSAEHPGAGNSSSSELEAVVDGLTTRLLVAEMEMKRHKVESQSAQETLQARVTVLETRLRFLENHVEALQHHQGDGGACNGGSPMPAGAQEAAQAGKAAAAAGSHPRSPSASGLVSAMALSAKVNAEQLNKELRHAVQSSGGSIAAAKGEGREALGASYSSPAAVVKAPQYGRMSYSHNVEEEFGSRAVQRFSASPNVVRSEGGWAGGNALALSGPPSAGGSATDELVSGLSSRYSEAMSFLQNLKRH